MTIVKRAPNCTYVKAEGANGRWGEFASTTLDDVWGRLERFHQDRQGVNSDELDILAERIVTQQTTQTAGRVVQMADPVLLPWAAYEPGDTINLNLAPKDVKGDKRVAAIVVSKGPNDAVPKYDVHLGAVVYSNDTSIVQGLKTLIRDFKRPIYNPMAGAPLPEIPPPTGGALEFASWVFAASDSSPSDKARADRVLPLGGVQTQIRDDILALGSVLVGGGTIGFLPGSYIFTDELANCDSAGNNTNDLFLYPLRFQGSQGVIWKFTSNPGTSKFFVRAGDTTGSGWRFIAFDGIQFDAGNFTNVEGVIAQLSVGLIPRALFTGCVFNSFVGDNVFRGERNYGLQVVACTFRSCVPTASFFHFGGFSLGNVYIAGNNFESCTGTLWDGAGFTKGGQITGNNFSSGMTIPTADVWVYVYHNRIAGVLVTGDHGGGTGTVSNRTAITGFHRVDLAASLTASQLERTVSAGVDAALPVVVTHAGSITGISVASTDARTAGTATFEVYKNGSATGLTCVLNGTNTTYAFAVQAVGLDTFVAGDRLDIRATTTGTWTPITADVEASIVVQYDAV